MDSSAHDCIDFYINQNALFLRFIEHFIHYSPAFIDARDLFLFVSFYFLVAVSCWRVDGEGVFETYLVNEQV